LTESYALGRFAVSSFVRACKPAAAYADDEQPNKCLGRFFDRVASSSNSIGNSRACAKRPGIVVATFIRCIVRLRGGRWTHMQVRQILDA
jgi:hypothetical protein